MIKQCLRNVDSTAHFPVNHSIFSIRLENNVQRTDIFSDRTAIHIYKILRETGLLVTWMF